MANAIALFQKYIALLDEVYKAASKTAVLDTEEKAEMTRNTHEFKVPKMTMDGLADYGRKGGGYKSGSVTIEYETKKPDYDRGRSFEVDEMDDEETSGIAFGKLAGEFIRTRVVPELDAYRFAVYASKAGNSASGALTTAALLMAALSTALTTMREQEVDEGGLYLFITPTLRQMIRDMDSYKSKEALTAFAGVVEVPQSRFYTAIDLLDGSTSGEEAGHFKKNADAADINFMIISKAALIQLSKHTVNKVFRPEENQEADAWKFCFRSYGIAETLDNKKNGIYLHKKAA